MQAWLDLPEIYHFTTLAALNAVEETLVRRPVGALTPSQAFTPDFILTIAGARSVLTTCPDYHELAGLPGVVLGNGRCCGSSRRR